MAHLYLIKTYKNLQQNDDFPVRYVNVFARGWGKNSVASKWCPKPNHPLLLVLHDFLCPSLGLACSPKRKKMKASSLWCLRLKTILESTVIIHFSMDFPLHKNHPAMGVSPVTKCQIQQWETATALFNPRGLFATKENHNGQALPKKRRMIGEWYSTALLKLGGQKPDKICSSHHTLFQKFSTPWRCLRCVWWFWSHLRMPPKWMMILGVPRHDLGNLRGSSSHLIYIA